MIPKIDIKQPVAPHSTIARWFQAGHHWWGDTPARWWRSRATQTITLRLLLASLLGLGGINVQGQVYSVGVRGGPMVTLRVDEHIWLIGGWPDGYGLLQFRSRTGERAPWVRSTTICFGRPLITVRLPAVLIVGICLMASCSFVWLAIAARNWTRTRHSNETDAT